MERRRRNRHAGPNPKRQTGYFGDPNNVIPTDRPLTNDEIIAGYGRALMRLGPLSNREFVMVFAAMELLEKLLGSKVITNKVVAWVVNMRVRGLHSRKIAIIKNCNDLSGPSTSPNGCSS